MEQESGAYHDMPTFKKCETVYDWIISMQKAVEMNFLTKESMEEAIKRKFIKK